MKQPEGKAGASALQSPPESHFQRPLESVRDRMSESEMRPEGGGRQEEEEGEGERGGAEPQL